MLVTREDLESSLARLRARVTDPTHGVFGPDSIAWRLGGDLVVFAGGGRAALLQLAHPFVAYAIDQHSRTRADVAGRFQRTFRNMFAMSFGDLDDAFTAARRVHSIHSRIGGVTAAGVRYEANDATSLRWVHATLVDTIVAVHARLGRAPAMRELDAFVTEQNQFAMLFGIPDDLLPATWREHERYMESMLAAPSVSGLEVAPCARDMAGFLFGRRSRPLGRLVEAITAELLPAWMVRDFGLAASPALARAGFAALAAGARLPRVITALPAHRDARRRLIGEPPSRIAAWTERQLFGLATRVSGTTSDRDRSV